jgi:hypothetical protein
MALGLALRLANWSHTAVSIYRSYVRLDMYVHSVGNGRAAPSLAYGLINSFWYAFSVRGQFLPSFNSRNVLMCLFLLCYGHLV